MSQSVIDIKKRFVNVRNELKLSQAQLANAIQVSATTLSKIESEKELKRLPTLSILIAMESKYNVNRAYIETGEGPMILDQPEVKRSNARDLGIIEFDAEHDTKFVDLGNGKYLMVVPLVDEFAHAGYLSSFRDSEFLEELPKHTIIVDKHHRGHYRAFEVVGQSMDDNTKESIADGSIATGREIKRELWRSKFHTHRYKDYIIVSKTEGIIIKRIIGQDVDNGVLKLHSLNPDKDIYPDFDLSLDDVEQIFNVVKVTVDR